MWSFDNTTNLIHAFWILLLQIPLLKAHLTRQSSSSSSPRSRSNSHPIDTTPTTIELCLATFIFWTVQFVFESTGTIIFVSLSGDGLQLGVLSWGNVIQTAIWGTLLSTFMATWALHLMLLAVLELVCPSLFAMYFYPDSTLQYTITRARNLIAFVLSLVSSQKTTTKFPTQPPPRRQSTKHQRTRSQSLPTIINSSGNNPNNIRLERTQSQAHLSGPRTLDWNLVIDSLAMNEMKSTLGPPGGFGELGFCVHKDGVKFECMGPGTSFSLTFKLEGDDQALNLYGNGNENPSVSSGKSRKKKR